MEADRSMEKEYVILPAETIELLLSFREGERGIYLPAEVIFPPGYVEYLEKVLNSNRHLPLFSYDYVEEDPIGAKGIWLIVRHQTERLMIGGRVCFQKVECVERSGEVIGIMAEYSPYNWFTNGT